MTLQGGDALASGARSAKFSTQAGTSQFENDLIFNPEIVAERYGLTEAEIEKYQSDRQSGIRIPELETKALVEERSEDEATVGFTVTDRRMSSILSESKPLAEKVLKFPKKQYTPFKPILDRILVKRINTLDDNMEVMSDGALRNKTTGFIIPPKYRQHSNTGVVLAVGEFVVVGGNKIPMSEIIQPGNRITYGDYNAEVFHMDEDKVIELCDAVEHNYEADDEGLRIVRAQDVRGVETEVVTNE